MWNWQQQRSERQTSKTVVFGVSCAAGCHHSSSLNPPPPLPTNHALSITLKVHSLPVSCTPRSCLRFLTQCQETDIMRPTRDCWAAPLASADSRFIFFILESFSLLLLLGNYWTAWLFGMHKVCKMWRKDNCSKQKKNSSLRLRGLLILEKLQDFSFRSWALKKNETGAGGPSNDAVWRQPYLWDKKR